MQRAQRIAGRIAIGGALLAGSALALVSGCAKTKRINHYPDLEAPGMIKVQQPAPEPAPAEPVAAAPAPAPAPAPEPTGGNPEPTPKDATGPLGSSVPELSMVYFELDKDTLSAETAETLKKHADYLKAHPELNVVIRGHTDSSGTDEYNIALGSKRAQAVRDRLVELGIAASRMETISYGENVPVAEGGDEEARKANRRAEFFVYTVQK